jgi:hypothetical protein
MGLLLGNGASVAVSSRFGYPSLFEEACSPGADAQLIADDVALFHELRTTNFEYVLFGLLMSERVSAALHLDSSLYRDSYDRIRQSLFYSPPHEG